MVWYKLRIEDYEDWLWEEVEAGTITPDQKRFAELLLDRYIEEVRLSEIDKIKIEKLFD